MKIEYLDVNANKLHDELIKVEIVPLLVESNMKDNEYIAEKTWITFADDVDMIAVQSVIDAHNPTLTEAIELTTDERIEAMAKELVLAQSQLEASQEALDYIIMGGM